VNQATDITVFSRDPGSASWLRAGGTVHVARRAQPDLADKGSAFLVLATASGLSAVSDFVSQANRLHRLRGLLVHMDMDANWLTQMLDRADLRTLRNCLVHSGSDVPQRVVEAWRCGAQNELIADITVTEKAVFALTCAFERLEVPIDSLVPLKKLSPEQRRDFQVAADGNYVYWPSADVHLDVDALRVAVNPDHRHKADLERIKRLADFGSRVRLVRKKHGLGRAALAGVPERSLRRIETGEVLPRAETLAKLAKSHGLTVVEYLNEVAEAAA